MIENLFKIPIEIEEIKFLSSNKEERRKKQFQTKDTFSEKWGNLNKEKGKKSLFFSKRMVYKTLWV